ncbi:outer membrane protein assembly factor [Ochrobactrum soli]|uniref:Autotransporter assembly complex family protein n=2 Tax=Ochrobactrum TaxID=528 RepID=A0ABD5JWL9_9HYPH|nr:MULTISPECIES: autotransporter assembly complex family protein [Brucella]RRD27790.1 outer membrane protein assembly factor [Brucellaceae bacterium VT-16-1752]WHT41352.1 autotransporter assembly complex family protein [Ochrobactrum sp. SSR]MDX4073935.1 autotransporter assembly complex family protein [Brucella sp. NBRC 113783]NNU59060.1 outer membrane protein assembly factor [[Ochrobactrum] soli]RLL75098.1 outer membrane protein assembly factor [[Ochrobactrum] soli]
MLLLAAHFSSFTVSPALAFELFGVRLWGEDKKTDPDIIDPKTYEVEVTTTGDRKNADGTEADLKSVVEGASGLVTDADKPASGSAGLLAKARGDYRRILAALYGEGRYGGTISILVDGREANDIPPDADIPNNAKVAISVDPGPQFLFSRTAISNIAPPATDKRDVVQSPEDAGFAPGQVARSGTIIKAERLAVEAWRQQGYPKAQVTGEEVVADHDGNTVAADVALDPGRKAHYGPVSVVGTARMDPQFVAWMTGLTPDKEYDPDDIEKAKKRLGRMEVFRAMSFEEAETIEPDGSLPMTLNVQERKPRRFGFGAEYSTIDGFGVTGYWMHRNLFGKGENLRFDAKVSGIGGSQDNSFNPQNYTYLLGGTFKKPGVYTPDTDFVLSLDAKREVLDAYTETSINAKTGFTQIFSDELSGAIYAKASQGRYTDYPFGPRDFTTAGLEGSVLYDSRNNKPDPSSGFYLEGNIQPFYEFHYGNFATRFTAEGRTYYGLGATDRVILAGRVKVGSIVGASIEDLPPSLSFLAGGGGSVRGYAYRNIGVDAGNGNIVGGRSLLEASGEVRTRITDSIGAVAFVDAGYVGEKSFPDFSEQMRVGAGGGLRYLTGLGPIRLDVAIPLNRRSGDPSYAFYVGIGQAF